MHHDHQPYYVRVGDSWTKIDYSKKPRDWMVPLQRGHETDLIEIPASWYLDDLPPMMFIKKSPNSHGFVNPRDIEQMWRDQFDWVYREHDYAVFPDDHPSRRVGAAARADDAGAALSAHDRPSRREVRHHERDGRRFRAALRRARSSRCARCAACWAATATGPMPPRGPASSRAIPTALAAAARAHGTVSPAPTACSSLYGLSLADWQGASFLLSTATGKTELVDNLAHLWAAAEKLRRPALRSARPAT